MKTIICKICGGQNTTRDRYCKFCGASLIEEGTEKATYVKDEALIASIIKEDKPSEADISESESSEVLTVEEKPIEEKEETYTYKESIDKKSYSIKDLIKTGKKLNKKAKRALSRCAIETAVNFWEESLKRFNSARARAETENPKIIEKLQPIIKRIENDIQKTKVQKQLVMRLLYQSIPKDVFISQGIPVVLKNEEIVFSPIYGQRILLNSWRNSNKSSDKIDKIIKFLEDPKKYNEYYIKVLKLEREGENEINDDLFKKLDIPLKEKDTISDLIDLSIEQSVLRNFSKEEIGYYLDLLKKIIKNNEKVQDLDTIDLVKNNNLNIIDLKIIQKLISELADINNYDNIIHVFIDFKKIENDDLDSLDLIATDYLNKSYEEEEYDLFTFIKDSDNTIPDVVKSIYLINNLDSVLNKSQIEIDEKKIKEKYSKAMEYVEEEDKDLTLNLLISELEETLINAHFILDLFKEEKKKRELKEIEAKRKEMVEETKVIASSSGTSPKTLKIFLSYSSKDFTRFRIPEISKRLEQHTQIEKVFFYDKDSGQNIVEYMEETLDKCNVFILFCSRNAKKSDSVKGEWQAAYQLLKKGYLEIIPVYENEEYIPNLLTPMLNVEYSPDKLDNFIEQILKKVKDIKVTPKKAKAEKIDVRRGYDYIGGLIRYKIVIENTTDMAIHNLSAELKMSADHVRIIDIKPRMYKKGDRAQINSMDPEESFSIEFHLEPLICGKIPIHPILHYKDAYGEIQSVIREALIIETTCPIIIKMGEENIANVKNIFESKEMIKSYRSFEIKKDVNNTFNIVREIIGEWAGKSVSEPLVESEDPFIAEIYYLVIDKKMNEQLGHREQIIIKFGINEKDNVAMIHVCAERNPTVSGVLTHIWEMIKDRFSDSLGYVLRSLRCPQCGASLDHIDKDTDTIKCKYCESIFKKYLI